jgi:hypothetical protein
VPVEGVGVGALEEVGVETGRVLRGVAGTRLRVGAKVVVRRDTGVTVALGVTGVVGRAFVEWTGLDVVAAGVGVPGVPGAPVSPSGHSTASSLVVVNAPPISTAAMASIRVPSSTPAIINARLRRPFRSATAAVLGDRCAPPTHHMLETRAHSSVRCSAMSV